MVSEKETTPTEEEYVAKKPQRRVKKRTRRSRDDEDDDERSASEHEFSESKRPFEILEKLPCSIDPPLYSTLNLPLSVKDSAVLYNALVQSRKVWMAKNSAFRLYWSKQYISVKEKEAMEAAGEDLRQNIARDKMQKLCDCLMEVGPHVFPIRIFIVKDEEIEKKWAEEQALKKERKKKFGIDPDAKEEPETQDGDEPKEEEEVQRKVYKKKVKRIDEKAQKQAVMIANLNVLAQANPSLHQLMTQVASRTASPEQVTEFQGYIAKASAMPPPKGFKMPYIEEEVEEVVVKRVPKVKKPKEGKDPNHLTTFQQKYLNGADLVFEFSECPNIRYYFPKCIVEKMTPESYLMSFIVMHNYKEMEKYEAKQQKKPTRGDQKPTPLYSAVTMKLTEIPAKYTQIVMNSVPDQKKLAEDMAETIREGRRLDGYNLWYQVDAIDDKDLAEELRVDLHTYESSFKAPKKKQQ